MKTNLTCKQCGKEYEYEYPTHVDISKNPEYKDSIMAGQAFLAVCPHCGMEQVVQYSLLYVDPEKKLAIAMAPDPVYDLAREEEERPVEEVKRIMESGQYVMRLVNNSNDLAEKIIVGDSPLDDRIVEMVKVCYFHSINEQIQKENTQLTDMLFGYEDGKGNFWIRLADGRAMTLDFDMDMYHEIEDEMKDNLDQVTPTGFCPINTDWAFKLIEAHAKKKENESKEEE